LNPKKSAREAKKKLAVRIVAGLLALLMVGGTAYSLIYMLMLTASAVDSGAEVLDDLNIRVGLMYGDGVTVGFETETEYGYTVGVQPLTDGVCDFTPFWVLNRKVVSVAADANLKKKDNTYSITKSAYNTAVGGYHIEFAMDFALTDMTYAESMMQNLDSVLQSAGLYSFPAYVGGVIRLRVGSFSSYEAAANMYAFVSGIMNFNTSVVSPSSDTVSVLDPASDRILFEYDCSDGTTLGLQAISVGDTVSYIKTPADNVYDGVFSYHRHQEEGIDGVSVVNVLTLDEYVEGVLPFEISNTWPPETLKAFSIAARSYAAYTLGRHDSAYNFDLCNGSHCQMYKGAGRVNDNVRSAVRSTHGRVITYDGKIASTYYSSSCGGVTVSIGDVWGGASSPYLVAHATPWERYSEHNKGFWTAEVSPKELLDYLRNQKGYTELSGYIKSIEVLEYAPSSSYVKHLRITDSKGTSIEIKNTDRIRMALGAYLNSANFVVGQGSVAYTLDTVQVLGEVIIDATVEKTVRPPVTIVPEPEIPSAAITADTLSVITANQIVEQPVSDFLILTADTVLRAEDRKIMIRSADGLFVLNEQGNIPSASIAIPRKIREYSVLTETKTAVASSPQNFIFVGKGWGHGAGMSQYGAKDLADLGYDYEHIINAYYSDVEIVYYKSVEQLQNRIRS